MGLALAVPASAAEKVTRLDRFYLWNYCRPLNLTVEVLSDDARKVGLRESDIETAVRSRLRGARIYDEKRIPTLYVNVNVVGLAFAIRVEFQRPVRVLNAPYWIEAVEMDPALVNLASTWDTGSVGTHGRHDAYILSSVSRHVDKFIDEYLRVNADACGKSK